MPPTIEQVSGTRVVCIGEGLVVLAGADAPALTDATLLRRSVGGAEGNVASGLVGLGVSCSWVSRVGADPFGRFVVSDLAGRGVDVSAVATDPHRPTGLYAKDRAGATSRMYYYRKGSAASAMDATYLSSEPVATALAQAELVHVSGNTLGVVDDAAGLGAALVRARDRLGFRLSVDLNWRPLIWGDRDAGALVDLLRAADVALLGADEAEVALGTGDLDGLRGRLGARPTIVLKSDDHEAVELRPDGGVTAVGALRVDVQDPIGAGDAFAAGYLAGLLDGGPPEHRLRLGHLSAATVLVCDSDHAPAVDPAVRQALLAASPDGWAAAWVDADGVHTDHLERTS